MNDEFYGILRLPIVHHQYPSTLYGYDRLKVPRLVGIPGEDTHEDCRNYSAWKLHSEQDEWVVTYQDAITIQSFYPEESRCIVTDAMHRGSTLIEMHEVDLQRHASDDVRDTRMKALLAQVHEKVMVLTVKISFVLNMSLAISEQPEKHMRAFFGNRLHVSRQTLQNIITGNDGSYTRYMYIPLSSQHKVRHIFRMIGMAEEWPKGYYLPTVVIQNGQRILVDENMSTRELLNFAQEKYTVGDDDSQTHVIALHVKCP